MAKSNQMMKDRGYKNDPIASWPFTVFTDGNRWPHTIFPTVPSLFFDRWEEGKLAKIDESWMSLVGPLVRCNMGGPTLPDKAPDLAVWLDAGTKPCIYVAFGTLVIMNQDLVSRLCAALLPQAHLDAPSAAKWRVLWALRREFWDLVPKAARESDLLRLEHFAPQVEILQSKKVFMMVSHHGQNSTTECLLAGKPMVGLPFFSDQHHWARIVQRAGISIKLNKNAPTSDILKAIEDIATNPKYGEAARALSADLQRGRPAAEQIDQLMCTFIAREVELKRKRTTSLNSGRAASSSSVAASGHLDHRAQGSVRLVTLLAALCTVSLLPRALRAKRLTPAGFAAVLGTVALVCNALNLRRHLSTFIRNAIAGGKW